MSKMQKITVDHSEICWRADEAHKRRKPWEPILREAYEMACPWRNPYANEDKNEATPPLNHLFDSTMLTSNFRATNRLLLDLTPPDQMWMDIKPGAALEMQLTKEQVAELSKKLGQSQRIIAMPFRGEMFINNMWELLLDARTAALGVMLVLENPKSDVEPVSFQAVPQNEVVVEDGPDGNEIGIYRTRKKFKVVHIKTMWNDAKLPDSLAKLKQEEKLKKEVTLTEATFLHDGKWVYRVYYREDKADPFMMVERVYDTNPWILFRWARMPGSEYGPSPVMMMMPDGRTANKVMEFLLKNAALALAGMYLVRDDGVLNPDNVQITPGGMIPVASTGGNLGASMVPLDTGRQFNLGQVILEDLHQKIRRGLQDNGLPDPSEGVRSPTEIMERMRELTQDIGGANGRLNSALVKLVRRVVDILSKRGYIPSMSIDNFTLRVQINSPLARAQQLQEVETVVKWIEICKAIGGEQMTMMVAKLEEILVWIAGNLGVPAELVRGQAERLEMQNQMAQLAAARAAGGGMMGAQAA